jgi:hypothetical protein
MSYSANNAIKGMDIYIVDTVQQRVVGEAKHSTGFHGLYHYRITSGEIVHTLRDYAPVTVLGMHQTSFAFDGMTGLATQMYADDNITVLKRYRAVDCTDFDYGMSPDWSKEIHGFGWRSGLNGMRYDQLHARDRRRYIQPEKPLLLIHKGKVIAKTTTQAQPLGASRLCLQVEGDLLTTLRKGHEYGEVLINDDTESVVLVFDTRTCKCVVQPNQAQPYFTDLTLVNEENLQASQFLLPEPYGPYSQVPVREKPPALTDLDQLQADLVGELEAIMAQLAGMAKKALPLDAMKPDAADTAYIRDWLQVLRYDCSGVIYAIKGDAKPS